MAASTGSKISESEQSRTKKKQRGVEKMRGKDSERAARGIGAKGAELLCFFVEVSVGSPRIGLFNSAVCFYYFANNCTAHLFFLDEESFKMFSTFIFQCLKFLDVKSTELGI